MRCTRDIQLRTVEPVAAADVADRADAAWSVDVQATPRFRAVSDRRFATAACLRLRCLSIANALVRTLEPPPASIEQIKGAQAIVVLGGGRNRGAPEWGGETINGLTLQRARYGARLARETGLPLYVTGGKPDGGTFAEGTLMRDLLAREFNVEVKWVDAVAATTRDKH